MPRLDRRAVLLGGGLAAAAFIPSQVEAHPVIVTPSPFAAGFFHSFTGFDHALAMVGVGFLSTKLLRLDVMYLPLTFLLGLALGAAGGHWGLDLRFAEAAVAASCFVLGGGVLSPRPQRYRGGIFVVVAGFAAVHGYVHVIEVPAGSAVGPFTLGFLSASAVMHLLGVFIGEAFKDEEHLWLVRTFASVMVVFGAVFLIQVIREGLI